MKASTARCGLDWDQKLQVRRPPLQQLGHRRGSKTRPSWSSNWIIARDRQFWISSTGCLSIKTKLLQGKATHARGRSQANKMLQKQRACSKCYPSCDVEHTLQLTCWLHHCCCPRSANTKSNNKFGTIHKQTQACAASRKAPTIRYLGYRAKTMNITLLNVYVSLTSCFHAHSGDFL